MRTVEKVELSEDVEEIVETISENVSDYCDFTAGGYVLMGIARSKDNSEITNSEEVVFREVILDNTTEYKVQRKCRNLVGKMLATGLDFYVYVSVNPRDFPTAFMNFMQQQTDWIKHTMNGDKNKQELMKRVGSKWISELQKPRNREQQRFCWDLDVKNVKTFGAVCTALFENTEVIHSTETVNGHHIITEPFNYNNSEFLQNMREKGVLELHTDGRVFIDHVTAADFHPSIDGWEDIKYMINGYIKKIMDEQEFACGHKREGLRGFRDYVKNKFNGS